MTLKKINEKLQQMFEQELDVPFEIERVSDIDNFHTRRALAGIKFICRDGGFNLDFETFAEVKVWFKQLIKDKGVL